MTFKQMRYNEEQVQAIHHSNGPALIVAGPGSGKTAVIVSRICALIEQAQIPAGKILAVTFSRKAADNMKRRFLNIMPGSDIPFFGTFHSIFFMILKQAYGLSSANIVSEDQKENILLNAADHDQIEYEDPFDFASALINEISKVKSGGSKPESFISSVVTPAEFRKLYEAYTLALTKQKLIDFDDMLSLCLKLLTEREDIRNYWQKRFRYILVDEFQDINLLQYQIIRILAAPQNNLFAVGDDDQSIYAFRGASPKIMRRFLNDYPDAVLIKLIKSYRCPTPVLNCSHKIIIQNKGRIQKKMESLHGSSFGIVQIRKCKNQLAEYESIAKDIRKLLREGTNPREVAILLRRSLEFPVIQKVLANYGITTETMQQYDKGASREASLTKHSSCVQLMTIHAAKGLEFRHVYLPDVSEGILPAKKSYTKDALEEERRILYVAMTRAAESLKIYFPEKIRNKKTAPSRFLDCFFKKAL